MNRRKPPRGWKAEDRERRVQWLKESTGVDYSKNLFDPEEELEGIIEQHIGYTSIPTAVASPLVVHGDYANGEFKLPVCTVEGALVYSLTRGMLATSVMGINTYYISQHLSRAPAFFFEDMEVTRKFCDFVDAHYEEIKKSAEATSSYAKLIEIKKIIFYRSVVLELFFTTGDAAGQNMVTIAAKGVMDYVTKHFDVRECFVESGLNSDKKASYRSLLHGRGHFVIARSVIKEETIVRLLNATSKKLVQSFQRMASFNALTGLFGVQLHFSNTLAAIYLAMGQDVACTAENALGTLFIGEAQDCEGAEIIVRLPSLTVGTVGGGTRLLSQKRNLRVIGCDSGENSSKKLAEIIAATTLCLELSLFCAVIDDTFSDAHKRYGRKQ
ncbi:uncharacterized protein LOC132563219 [Ylistrum balloti]|uniref:uncharacterized protein LOC132563219 n=1 Tax=Ylistrum balloti TaxID=509963 RepID=UPI002905CE3C|nr:uncharacterized protein LOC132563219 [Ylistrum balloti]